MLTMKNTSLSAVLFTTALFATGPLAPAQDMVTLHSVTIDANDDVTVVYSKNFATCAHMRFSNAGCTQFGALTHVQNHFCTSGSMVAVTVPLAVLNSGLQPGIDVFMVHGNNSGVSSACVTVGCDGVYGVGCAGTAGVPALGAVDVCPPAPGSLDLTVSNALPNGIGVLGFGVTQANVPLFGCNLLIGGLLVTGVVLTDGTGAGGFVVPLPAGASGVDLTMQAFLLDSAGAQDFAATNGLRVRVL
jgi:hypothetical protein